MKPKLAIFISGRGSNMVSLIDAVKSHQIDADIIGVFSDKPHAIGLKKAKEYGLKTYIIQKNSGKLDTKALHQNLQDLCIDYICLAGFMRVLNADFVTLWEEKIINIHPSLLPKYPGLHPQKQALEAGASESGATVHIVTKDVDAGPIIDQARVQIEAGDTIASLSARILRAEHQLYPRALKKLFSTL